MSDRSINPTFQEALKTILALCFFAFPLFSYSFAGTFEIVSQNNEISCPDSMETETWTLVSVRDNPNGTGSSLGSDWSNNCEENWFSGTHDFWGTEPKYFYMYLYYPISEMDGWISEPFYWDGVSFEDQGLTRIVSLDPEHGSTTPSGNDVFFRARAYIADEPSFWDTINISLRYNDENHILSELTDFYEVELYSGLATTTGVFDFSTTTPLEDGNYTVIFSLRNSTLGGTLNNPFGGDQQEIRHQFIVGSSTYLGQINQNIISDLNQIFASTSPTSTAALLSACAPWDWGGFSIKDCLSGLLIPDTATMYSIVNDFRAQIMQKAPWGYGTRLFAIVSGSSTSTPPVLVFTVPDDEYFSSNLRNKTISFDPWQAVAEGSILEQADGFGEGNLMDTFMPYWRIIIYSLVVFGVVHKLFNMSRHAPKTNKQVHKTAIVKT